MSKSSSKEKQITAKTTAIEVNPPEQFDIIEREFILIKYVLPRMLTWDKKDPNKYAKMHHEIKENLDAPYRVFTHDHVGGSRRWSLFTLFPVEAEGESKNFPILLFDGEPLKAQAIPFSEPPLHVLIKLLQVAYTRQDEQNQSKKRFVGQDKCYLYAKRNDEDGHYHTCLEMELRGDIQNENIFYIEAHAQTFAFDKDLNPDYINRNTYFQQVMLNDELIMFKQVKRSTVQSMLKEQSKKIPLFTQRTFSGRRATLDFHAVSSLDDMEQTRGYLTDTFIRGFATYLNDYGFDVKYIQRDFIELSKKDRLEDFELDIATIAEVFVLDKRFSKHHPIDDYLRPLRKEFAEVSFQLVDQIDDTRFMPVIVFEDCEAKAFKEGMPLDGETDPHEAMYYDFPQIPKQFINVNPNALTHRKKGDSSDSTLSREDYLDYEFEALNENMIQMLMNQLFLKDVILNHRSVSEHLPLSSDLMFVHREHQMIDGEKVRFEIAMRFDKDRLLFYDLINDQDDLDEFNCLLQEWEVDWNGCYKKMVEYRRGLEDGKDLPSFDIIVGRKLCVEITGGSEAVLYDYEELVRRQEEVTTSFEIDDLKLLEKYDDVIGNPKLSRDILEMHGFLPHQSLKGKPLAKPKNKKQRDAVSLYESLMRYDELLESLKASYPFVSFHELTNDENIVPLIVELFGSALKLQNKYKEIGMFKGSREADMVSVYTGIWYTQDHRYVVGSTTSMNSNQPNAHRIRQFKIYQGEESFKIKPMLKAMSVAFIRLNQYTVYPYYFHLIDLFIDNVIKYKYQPPSIDDLYAELDENDLLS